MEDIKQYLAMLAEMGERDDPLVFAGRREIVERIPRASKSLPSIGQGVGRTFLIQGAPGVGKTALISELARRLKDEGVFTIVRREVLEGADIVRAVYSQLAVGLGAMKPEEDRTTTASRRETSGGFGALFRGLLSRSKSVAPPSIADSEDIAKLRGGREWRPGERAVIFMDEVQNLTADGPMNLMLRDLHTQSNIPVLLVCAGLSNSKIKLNDAGLSRINAGNIIPLGRLAPEETLDCARRTFEKVRDAGLPASDEAIGWWAERIAGACDDWPRHLQCYLTACWKTLANQDASNLDTADLESAMALGDDLRSAYYVARVEASRTDIRVLGALHSRLRKGGAITTEDVCEVIDEARGLLSPARQDLFAARFSGVPDCFEQILKSGVVSLDEQGRCVSPVPSLSDHILSEYAEDAGDSSGRADGPSPPA